MSDNGVLKKNEQDANRLTAKIMLVFVSFLTLVYFLEFFGIFHDDIKKVTMAFSIAFLLLLVPFVLVYILKLSGAWVKYAIITMAGLLIAIINMFLSKDVVLLYVFAIAIASLYFSRSLSWYAVIFSIVILSASQIIATDLRLFTDRNYGEEWFYAVVPRDLELLIVSLIYIVLAKRTKKLLENMLGAEQQKEMIDRLSTIMNKSVEVSNTLSDSLRKLSQITDNTKDANEHIAQNTSRIASGSEDTLKYVESTLEASENMSGKLDNIASECKLMADISDQAQQLSEESVNMMKDADAEIKAIRETTDKNKILINNLSERSNEIGRIVEIITSISAQTNMLALNAAIESARAGEQGKGFAVVADEIRKLAEQSEKAAKDISALIKKVLAETESAVVIIDSNSEAVDRGISIINQAGKAVLRVSVAEKDANTKIREINRFTQEISAQGNKIVEFVRNIKGINNTSMDELQDIAAAAEQQLASMQQVASSVDAIEGISNELLQVVSK